MFWDQATPAGQDWDSWIREQLTGARLVVALWTKASVASPNVRHEAIIGRDTDKLLPLMVDELTPTDFPDGSVHGTGAEDRPDAARVQCGQGQVPRRGAGADRRRGGEAAGVPKRRKSRRELAIGLAVAALLVAIALFFAGPRLMFMIDPDAPPVSGEQLRRSIDVRSARPGAGRARSAENRCRATGSCSARAGPGARASCSPPRPARAGSSAGRYFDYLRRGRECRMRLLLFGQHPARGRQCLGSPGRRQIAACRAAAPAWRPFSPPSIRRAGGRSASTPSAPAKMRRSIRPHC